MSIEVKITKSIEERLGNPYTWDTFRVRDEMGVSSRVSHCPVCSSVVLSASLHAAWHLKVGY
jgi:hypothetical protein